ncbi:sensor histidine kinase [Microbacterium paludicola]|uniref:sensor histidine kinase n=1 Tax=Microbacterium paludicola TaxID=300019 RepID=UPI001642BA00|nr:histidine kinase [Microbacterium paludicola]
MASELRHTLQRLNAHPRGRDAVAAALYLLLGIALLQFGGFRLSGVAVFAPSAGIWTSETIFLLLLFAMAALATMRSTHPLAVLAAGIPLVAVDVLLGTSLGVVILFSDFVYCAFRYGSDRGVRVVLAVILVTFVAVGITLVVWHGAGVRYAPLALQWALFVLLSALWGWNVRSERERTRAAMAQTHARSMQQLRQRVAHDLHDLVANQIAVAGLNIEAARLRASTAAETGEIDQILARAKSGTDDAHRELRRLIALLTTVDDVEEAREPSVSARRLDDLVPSDRRLVRTGEPLEAALAGMPPRAAGIVVRAVQELVMNAVRHGTGDVALAVTGDEHIDAAITVQVSNRVAETAAAVHGSGIGIAGATMLLSDVDGAVVSAATDDGRWHAVVTVGEARDV